METTITDKTILLSKKGFKELKRSIVQLEHDKNDAMRLLRDLDKTYGHEERLSRIERLAEIESIDAELQDKKYILENAKLLPDHRLRLRATIGSVVEIIDHTGRMFKYKLVNSIEANPSDGRISILSPLGRCLVGRTSKDIVECYFRNKSRWFRLIRIT